MAIHVDYESLVASQNYLTQKREELDSTLQQIQSRITQLTTTDFVTDAASGSLDESMRAFVQNSTATIADLDDYARHLGNIISSYQQTDSGLRIG